MPDYVIVGSFTLDDTVLPNGQVRYRAPGGNGVYAAVGAHVWSDSVGILSRVGANYPEENLACLRAGGLDLAGVTRVARPDIHLWILYEAAG
jgi:sugar/nucleoside kinase (ribokinase family)